MAVIFFVINIDSIRHPLVEMCGMRGFLLLLDLYNPKPGRPWAWEEAVFRVMKKEGDGDGRRTGGQKGKKEEGREGEEMKILRYHLANSGYGAWAVSNAIETQRTA